MKDVRKRILVIDDEAPILRMLTLRLSRMGLDVETALTKDEAIKKLNANGYDLVLTDMIMPEISGNDVLNHVRIKRKHSTPVLAMSGTPWLLEQSDFDAVINKPCSKEELQIVINRFLNKETDYLN
jgi:CheY-like chemotaxis protein